MSVSKEEINKTLNQSIILLQSIEFWEKEIVKVSNELDVLCDVFFLKQNKTEEDYKEIEQKCVQLEYLISKGDYEQQVLKELEDKIKQYKKYLEQNIENQKNETKHQS